MLSSSQLKSAFDEFDKDKSGQLDLNEVVKLANQLGVKTAKKELEALFTSIDADRDSKLSFEEFLAWYRVGKQSGLNTMLRYQINMTRYFSKLDEQLKKIVSSPGNSNSQPFLLLEIKDKVATKSHFSIECTKDSADLLSILERGGINKPQERLLVILRMRLKQGTDSKELSVWTTAIETIRQILIPFGFESDENGFLKVLNENNQLFTVIDFTSNRLFKDLGVEFFNFFSMLGIESNLWLNTEMELNVLTQKVLESRGKDPETAKKLLKETNIFKFFLSGLCGTFVLKLDPKYKEIFLEQFIFKFFPSIKQFKGLIMMFKMVRGKISLSSDDTFGLLMDFLDHVKVPAPDGSDLIDYVGEFLSELQFPTLVQSTPLLASVLSFLHDHVLFDVDFGAMNKSLWLHASAKTAGLRELYDCVLAGFS